MRKRELFDQARAFLDLNERLNHTDSTHKVKKRFRKWAESKDFASADEDAIWNIVYHNLWHRKSGALARNKGVRKTNPERKERVRDGLVYGRYHEWVGHLPCILAGIDGHACRSYRDGQLVKGHHVKSVGAGGKDRGNEVPMCFTAHIEVHRGQKTFEEQHQIDLQSVAAALANFYPYD